MYNEREVLNIKIIVVTLIKEKYSSHVEGGTNCPSKICWYFPIMSCRCEKSWWILQVPSIAKDMPNLITFFLAYDIWSQSISRLTSSTEFVANCKKNLLPKLMSFPDHWPSVRGVFCQVFATIRSIFLASHLLVHASFTLEIIKISAGWHKYVEHGGKYFRKACFASKTTLSCRVIV